MNYQLLVYKILKFHLKIASRNVAISVLEVPKTIEIMTTEYNAASRFTLNT